MRTVLFLCTGNYYRSRFAEHLFNHLARTVCPDWIAISRALALERGHANVGPISPLAVAALRERGIALAEPERRPIPLAVRDLDAADLVVAVKRDEHRPLLEARFPDWLLRHPERIVFWDVDDIEVRSAENALSELADDVEDLCRKLASGVGIDQVSRRRA